LSKEPLYSFTEQNSTVTKNIAVTMSKVRYNLFLCSSLIFNISNKVSTEIALLMISEIHDGPIFSHDLIFLRNYKVLFEIHIKQVLYRLTGYEIEFP